MVFPGHRATEFSRDWADTEMQNLASWNLKHLFINGCFNWMIPDLYLGNGCFTKHPFKTGCLGYQVVKNLRIFITLGQKSNTSGR